MSKIDIVELVERFGKERADFIDVIVYEHAKALIEKLEGLYLDPRKYRLVIATRLSHKDEQNGVYEIQASLEEIEGGR